MKGVFPDGEEIGVQANEPGDGGGAQATFDGALRGLRATGASVGMRALVELIVRHGAEEGQLLATYEELSGEAPDESVRYLTALILEDERRHHRLLAELANAIAWGSGREPREAAMPGLPGNIGGELLEQTKLLRASEEADYRALRRIRRKLRPFADTTLWVLVIDLMLLDTKKHATILGFLERHRNHR
jgi:rubrerythrin